MKRSVKKGNKGEEIVTNVLNKQKDDYFLINNLILLGENNISHQFDHILIRHNGIFVIETKNYYGEISGNIEDTYWKKTYYLKGKVKVDSFMNPLKQNNAHIRYLKKIIGKNYPLYNFVVFVNNDVSKLNIYNVTNEHNLLGRIINISKDNVISLEKMKEINNYLLYMEADIQDSDHLNNIKEMKKNRKEKIKIEEIAIEKEICPMCGFDIKRNKNVYLCPRCGYKLVV